MKKPQSRDDVSHAQGHTTNGGPCLEVKYYLAQQYVFSFSTLFPTLHQARELEEKLAYASLCFACLFV